LEQPRRQSDRFVRESSPDEGGLARSQHDEPGANPQLEQPAEVQPAISKLDGALQRRAEVGRPVAVDVHEARLAQGSFRFVDRAEIVIDRRKELANQVHVLAR
jgi:hypothetical protein